MSEVEAQEIPADVERDEPARFSFHGTAGELFPIFIVNLLLTVVTLGVFRFWARTRVRRYLWSRIRFMNDEFEYTGTGMELFIGFVIVFFLVLLPAFGLLYWAQLFIIGGESGQAMFLYLVIYLTFFWLNGAAIYRAHRYRLSRTIWRGIRGHQREKGYKYGTIYLGSIFGQIFTAGLTAPYFTNMLWSYEMNRREFGSGRFSYHGSAGALYKPFFMSLAIAIGGFIGLFALMAGAIAIFGGLPTITDPNAEGALEAQIYFFMVVGIAFYIGAIIVIGAASLFYQQRLLVHFGKNSFFDDIRMQFDVTMAQVFRLWFGNLLIMILTLGLGEPFVELRRVRFFADNLVMLAEPDVDQLEQSSAEISTYGEGLAEAFDVGGI